MIISRLKARINESSKNVMFCCEKLQYVPGSCYGEALKGGGECFFLHFSQVFDRFFAI